MAFICEFCKHTFSKKWYMLTHQKTAKYCLKLRGERTSFFCDICNKDFTEKRCLENHREKCDAVGRIKKLTEENAKLKHEYILSKKNTEEQIGKYEKIISELQARLENIAIQGVKKSTTITNNTINLQPLTKEWLKSQALLLTEEHLSQGVAGLAQFAVDNSFKDRVVCTDITRKSLKYKENDGKVSKDPRGKKLSKMFFESIEAKAEDIIPTMIERIKEEMDDVCEESGGVFESVCIKMDEIIKVKKGIKHITKGQEHELKEEFTKQLCELLPNP